MTYCRQKAIGDKTNVNFFHVLALLGEYDRLDSMQFKQQQESLVRSLY